MRHFIKLIFAAIIAIAVSSCELETSGNGDLDGMWRLTSVDTISTGRSRDMRDERIFWAFQNKLLELDDKAHGRQSVLFRFERNGGTLRLYNPYMYDRENGDKPADDVKNLEPFGVEALEVSYTVESLGGSRMVLRSENIRLQFRKF